MESAVPGLRFSYSAHRIPHSALLVSVAGLAPARVGLKTRLLELLCIHGRKKWSDGVLESWSAGFQHSITPPLHYSVSASPRASCR